MSQKFSNNASTTLSGAITAGATSITVANGALLPLPSGGTYFLLTLIGLNANGIENTWEIVKVTARSGNVLTVVRAQEGTTALAWPTATLVEARLTAGSLDNKVDVVAGQSLMTDAERTKLSGIATGAAAVGSTVGSAAGTAAAGTAITAARSDHVHPLQTTVSGNAGTATALQTGRTIGMTGDVTWISPSFNGSANVTAAATLASTGVVAGTYPKVTVDAKGRVTAGAALEASDIPTLNQSTTGNAATATKLATARTINNVAFDGTANITVEDDTKLPLTGGTITGTTLTINPTSGNAGIEFGGTRGVASTPFIDFHSGATVADYDSRIIADGGNGSPSNGNLKYYAATHTFNGKVITLAPVTGGAYLNLPHGTTPATLVNGDLWTTTSGMYVRINGVTRDLYHSGNLVDVSQAEAEAGTATTRRAWTAQRVRQAIAAGAPVSSVNSKTGAVVLSAADVGAEPADASIVKAAAVQTLTNKTFTGYTETVYALAGTDINPSNGTIQHKTLTADTTFTESLADGQSVTLMINPGTYTVTWPAATWIGSTASTAPTLVASVYNCIVLFQFDGVLYAKYEGRV